MIKLAKREWEILQFLLAQDRPVPLEVIASHFAVSVRTIRNDLGYIESFLKSLNIHLERRSRIGIWIENKFHAINKIGIQMQYMDNSMYRVFSRRERVEKIIGILFIAEGYVTIHDLAEYLFVHRTTVSKSLEEAKHWMDKYGLVLKKKPGCGIKMEADERTFRFSWLEYIRQAFSIEVIHNILHSTSRQNRSFRYEHLQELIQAADTVELINEIGRLSEKTGIVFSEESICEQVLYLCMAMHRVRLGYNVDAGPAQLSSIKKSSIYDAVADLMNTIGRSNDVEFNEGEKYLAAVKFLVSRIKHLDESKYRRRQTKNEEYIAEAYIKKASIIFDAPLDKDPILRKNLLLHIHITLACVQHSVAIKNPVTEQVKREYPLHFEIIQKITDSIRKTTFYPNDENEISYITMHILGALQRFESENQANKIRTLLACASGLGTSKLLSARIRSEFKELEIVGEIPVSLVRQYAHSADIVISTIPVNEVLLIPVVTISPLLTDAELVKIRNAIDKLRGRRSDAPQNRVVEIMDIVRKYSKIEDESLLAQALEKQLYGKVQDSWRRNLMLTDMITEDRIRVGVSAEDKEDAVRKVGQLLVEGQLASPGYVDAMIRLMNELGAYIVIAPGVAMPHARSEDGAKKTGLAILVPNKPVVFGHQKNDPVRIILALVATDNKSHLQAMRELSTLISREEILEEVILSKTPEELLNRIKQFEEQYVKKG